VAKFQRPADDLWVIDFKSDLDIVRRYTAAGFDPMPREVARLRLFILYDFLWANRLRTDRLAARPEDVKPDTALHKSRLTDDGYFFLQKYLPRWQGRLYRHTTDAKKRGFLAKWYAQFAVSKSAKPGTAPEGGGK
jgi:hypothetical protein